MDGTYGSGCYGEARYGGSGWSSPVRRCLKIPFLIGQREDTIIGNSCASNPAWEVPCHDDDFAAVACAPGDYAEVDDGAGVLAEVDKVGVSLSEPTKVPVTF